MLQDSRRPRGERELRTDASLDEIAVVRGKGFQQPGASFFLRHFRTAPPKNLCGGSLARIFFAPESILISAPRRLIPAETRPVATKSTRLVEPKRVCS